MSTEREKQVMSRLIVWVADKHLNELDIQPRTGILREAGFLYKASSLGYLTCEMANANLSMPVLLVTELGFLGTGSDLLRR